MNRLDMVQIGGQVIGMVWDRYSAYKKEEEAIEASKRAREDKRARTISLGLAGVLALISTIATLNIINVGEEIHHGASIQPIEKKEDN